MLSPTLQDGKKIPKWAPRARRGKFLGFSKSHSSTIGLLRNLQTGYVTPQFHVVFDELFTTVHSSDEDDTTWVDLFTTNRDYYGQDEDELEDFAPSLPEVDPAWLPITELPLATPPGPVEPMPTEAPHGDVTSHADEESLITVFQPADDDIDLQPAGGEITMDNTPEPLINADTHPPPTPPAAVQTGKRTRLANKRVFGDEWVNHTVQLTPSSRTIIGHIVPGLNHDDIFLHSLDWDAPFSEDFAAYHSINLLHTDPFTNEVD